MGTVVAIVLVVLSTACGAAAQGEESSPARKARIEIMRSAPLVIRGSGFESRERVRVLASAAGVQTRRVQASAAGTFTVELRGLQAGRCTALVIQAIGDAGSRAMVDRPTLDCIEP